MCKLDKLEDREVIFDMWKISFSFYLFFLTTLRSMEGLGDIKLSPYTLERFEAYLSKKNHNKNQPVNEKHGYGLVFSVSTDGSHSGYFFCPQGKTCDTNEAKAKNYCQSKTKKKYGKKVVCKTFAINCPSVCWMKNVPGVPLPFPIKKSSS